MFVSEEAVCDIGVYWAFERANSTSDALFLTEDGRPLTASRIQKILERIGKKAGIKRRLSPHKLRHSYATVSLKNGANLDYVRRTLGHTDIATTEVYLELTDADVQQAHKKFSPIANLRNN